MLSKREDDTFDFKKVKGGACMFLTGDLPVKENDGWERCTTCLAGLPFQSVLPDFSGFSFLSPVDVCTGSNQEKIKGLSSGDRCRGSPL